MTIPTGLKYSQTHEWAKLEDDGTVTVGITHHAQDLLGDMVFVEMPEIGRKLKRGEECGVVESVKAASDIYAPLSGTVAAVNADLEDEPGKINQDAYAAWMFKIKPDNPGEMNDLLDAARYQELVESEAH